MHLNNTFVNGSANGIQSSQQIGGTRDEITPCLSPSCLAAGHRFLANSKKRTSRGLGNDMKKKMPTNAARPRVSVCNVSALPSQQGTRSSMDNIAAELRMPRNDIETGAVHTLVHLRSLEYVTRQREKERSERISTMALKRQAREAEAIKLRRRHQSIAEAQCKDEKQNRQGECAPEQLPRSALKKKVKRLPAPPTPPHRLGKRDQRLSSPSTPTPLLRSLKKKKVQRLPSPSPPTPMPTPTHTPPRHLSDIAHDEDSSSDSEMMWLRLLLVLDARQSQMDSCIPTYEPDPGHEDRDVHDRAPNAFYYAIVSKHWSGVVSSAETIARELRRDPEARTFTAPTWQAAMNWWKKDCLCHHDHDEDSALESSGSSTCSSVSAVFPSSSISAALVQARSASPMKPASHRAVSPSKPKSHGTPSPTKAIAKPPPRAPQKNSTDYVASKFQSWMGVGSGEHNPVLFYGVSGHNRIFQDWGRAMAALRTIPDADLIFTYDEAEVREFVRVEAARMLQKMDA
ncbi:hypothetical protein C8R45DRAFT_1111049 [Mycena sanguinolenta]|nr:hypothetical protein C8R45DRAFT_1111049 [Mycena sanguinolenta]